MKLLYPVLMCSTLLATGCATREPPSSFQTLTQEIRQLQQDETVNRYAAVELDDAEKQVERTKSALDEDETAYEHQLYLAENQINITRKRAEAGSIQNQLKEAENRRSELLLSAREREIDRAKSKAASAEDQLKRLQSEMKNVKAEQTNRGLVLTLQDVLFELNKSELHAGGKRTIQTLAEFLQENPETNVTVEGFTDALGDEQYNMELSRKRAQAVVNELNASGIARNRVDVKAYGEQYPVATNESEAGRQQNRRVQMVLSGKDQDYKNPSME